jgi:hypothetical protein
MTYPTRWCHGALVISLAAVACSMYADAARATCNVIPHTGHERHRGALGSVSRPFASPDEWLDLAATPKCDQEEFADSNANGSLQDEYRVLMVFEPQTPTAQREAVVIAESCTGVDLSTCTGTGTYSVSAHCIEVNQTGVRPALQTRNAGGELRLEVRTPSGTCDAGQPTICYRDQDCATGARCVAPADRVLTGPLTIAARGVSQPVPCELIAGTCAANARGQPGFGACVDWLYSGARCGGVSKTDIDPTFPGFTALPPPNEFGKLCDYSGPYEPTCKADPHAEVRFALDLRNNMFVPMSWKNVLDASATGLARFVTGSTAFPARPGGRVPIRITDSDGSNDRPEALVAYSPEGVRLPSFFQVQLGRRLAHELELFGNADADQSVLRIARRSGLKLGNRQCVGGDNPLESCWRNKDCPNGTCAQKRQCLPSGTPPECSDDSICTDPDDECGRANHEMASRTTNGGVGPVEIPRAGTTGRVCNGGANDGKNCPTAGCADGAPCVDYRARALWPVPLHGTRVTNDLIVTALSEVPLKNIDLDGDGKFDSPSVVVVRDKKTLEPLPIGVITDPGPPVKRAMGRAVVNSTLTVGGHAFEFPVFAVAGSVVALVEDCAKHPATCDNTSDPKLRVYKRPVNQMKEVADNIAMLPAPGDFIDGRRIAVTPAGKVLFRAKRSDSAVVALHVLNALSAVPTPKEICPATNVSVSDERVAFLRPEADGACDVSGTVTPIDLNGDNDKADTVVQRSGLGIGAETSNLHCAATKVVFRDSWIAVAVPEAQQDETDLNGDGDIGDDVLFVHPAVGRSTTCLGSKWMNAAKATVEIDVAGDAIASLNPNKMMQVAFATSGSSSLVVQDVGAPTEEFELGNIPGDCKDEQMQMLAFRTEIAGVSRLQLYDVLAKKIDALVGTDVRPCDEIACDPRRPYAVDGTIVRALQPCSSGNGSCIEVYDACREDPDKSFVSVPQRVAFEFEAVTKEPGSVELGGRCVENLHRSCDTDAECGIRGLCLPDPEMSGKPSCFADSGWCRSPADCPSLAKCEESLSLVAYQPGEPPAPEREIGTDPEDERRTRCGIGAELAPILAFPLLIARRIRKGA